MAMLGESMHAHRDGVAAADHRPLIASAVCIGASHDLDSGQSVLRQLVCSRAATQNGVIPSEGLATDFGTALRACRDIHAAFSPRIALQQEDERYAQGIALQASQVCRSQIVMLQCRRGAAPVLPGCGEQVTFLGNERR